MSGVSVGVSLTPAGILGAIAATTVVSGLLDAELRKALAAGDWEAVSKRMVDHLPVVGSGKQAVEAYQDGHYKLACLYGILAVVEASAVGKGVKELGMVATRGATVVGKTTTPFAKKLWGKQGAGVQRTSKSLTIPGSGEWKSTRWNIGEAAVHKKHHNWHKIFGDKKPTLKEIDPYVKEALTKGQWKKTGIIRENGTKKILGDKIEIVQEVNGHKIWLGGIRESTGEVIINNAAVQ